MLQALKSLFVALICLSLAFSNAPSLAETASPPAPTTKYSRQPYESIQLQGDQRILHALNRFTFGPRLGDLETIRNTGLDKWFDQQLHPAAIDESGLNARLAQFPAMQLTAQDLLFRLPSKAVIRQIIDGKAQVPNYPALRPVYQNEVARVKFRKQEKAEEQQRQASFITAAPNNAYCRTKAADSVQADGRRKKSMVRPTANPRIPLTITTAICHTIT